jgi:type IV secretory pathway VirD2 relaxase
VRRLAIGRLQKLERMGLAAVAGPGQWMVGLDAEHTLRDHGMQGDIIKTMHRAFTERGQDRAIADYVIDAGTASSPIIGRLVVTGLHDELTGEAYAVIDGTDGRAHHVRSAGSRPSRMRHPRAVSSRSASSAAPAIPGRPCSPTARTSTSTCR